MQSTPPESLAAEKQLDAIIGDKTAPKGLGQGLTRGVGNIMTGAVGGVGVAVLAPTAGLAMGLQNAGIVGGVFGLVGGAVIGVVGGAAMLIGGAVSGVVQIARGIIAAPEAMLAPSQGKWWNSNIGKWTKTDMNEEKKSLDGIPEDDSDLLGKIQEELDKDSQRPAGAEGKAVKETFYYDTLDVPPDAEANTIRRKYYTLAKKYHPDRNEGNAEAAEKFKDIAEAYQVLSDPELRKKYDKDGKEGLSPDKTSTAEGGMPQLDPAILYAFLFGSDRFAKYTGRLATETSASIGDSPNLSLQDARKLQWRRVTRLALYMIEKIDPYVKALMSKDMDKDSKEAAKKVIEADWLQEGKDLSTASYGYQLVSTLGQLYNLMAVMYQGSINSGQGLPSVANWAERQKARTSQKSASNHAKMETLRAGMDMMKLQAELQQELQTAKTPEDKEKIQLKLQENSVGILLRVLWTTTVVDITSTVDEMTHMIFFDQAVEKDVRMARSEALKQLGKLWMEDVPEPAPVMGEDGKPKDPKQVYEEAAFAAMLETVKRRDASQAHKQQQETASV